MSAPPPPPPPRPPQPTYQGPTASKMGPMGIVGASLIAGLGAILPWAVVSVGVFERSVAGTDGGGDGTLVLIGAALAVLAGGVMVATGPNAALASVAMLAGMGIVAISVIDVVDVASRVADSDVVSANVGVGLYLCLVAGVAIVAFGISTAVASARK